MASIQRSLLIEAPVAISYSFWLDFERYPSFMEDVARVTRDSSGGMTWHRRANGDTVLVAVRVEEQVENRLLSWRAETGPETMVVLTFAPLEGEATWFTLTMEFSTEEGTDIAGQLTAVSRRIDRELALARELIEAAALDERRKTAERNCH